MFINFIFDNYDGHANFFRYIKTVKEMPKIEGFSEIDDTKIETPSSNQPETQETKLFSKVSSRLTNVVDQSIDQAYSLYNKLLLSLYTKGNKIKFYNRSKAYPQT